MSEPMLRLVIGKYIRNDSGNSHIVGIDKIMVSSIELFKWCHQFGPLMSLAQQPSSEQFSAFLSPDTWNRLLHSRLTVKRRLRMHVLEGYYCSETESSKWKNWSHPVCHKATLQAFHCQYTDNNPSMWQSPLFPFFKFTWVDEFQILCKLCVFQRQYIIYIPVSEIVLLCNAFFAGS